MYSAISVRLVGNNSLIHLLRILTSLELFLIHEFYSKHPVLTDVYNNGKTVLGEKLFCSFESVFELNIRLRDSQTRINNKDLIEYMQMTTFGHLFCAFWLSLLWSVDQFIYSILLVGFKNISKCLIKKFNQGKVVTVTNVLSCYVHFSVKIRSSFTE